MIDRSPAVHSITMGGGARPGSLMPWRTLSPHVLGTCAAPPPPLPPPPPLAPRPLACAARLGNSEQPRLGAATGGGLAGFEPAARRTRITKRAVLNAQCARLACTHPHPPSLPPFPRKFTTRVWALQTTSNKRDRLGQVLGLWEESEEGEGGGGPAVGGMYTLAGSLLGAVDALTAVTAAPPCEIFCSNAASAGTALLSEEA